MTNTLSTVESEDARGATKLSWRAAIVNAWSNSREYALKSAMVSSLAAILRMMQGFVIQGFIIWIALGTLMFLVHIEEDARLQRKAIRLQHKTVQPS